MVGKTNNSSNGKKLSAFNTNWTVLRDIMHRNVVTVNKNESIVTAAKQMSDRGISCMIVTKGDEILGLVTETDFLRKVVADTENYARLVIEQIMTSPVVSLCDTAGLVEASEIMAENKVKRLPVTADGKLVGIVTQTDLIQAMTTHIYSGIDEIMTETVAHVDKNKTAAHAARIMAEKKISCMVVMDSGKVAGIITERDILKKIVAAELNPATVDVQNIMTSPVISVPPTYSAFSTGKIMESRGIRRILVIQDEKLCGIITQTDIFRAAKQMLEEQKKQSRLTSESSDNCICDLNPKGIITYINPAFAELLAVKNPDELLNKPFLPEQFWIDPAYGEQFLSELLSGTVELKEFELKTARDKELYVAAFITCNKTLQGNIESIRAVIYDISARKEFAAQANHAAHEAVVADLAKSRFLTNMSHEIRTPLNAIIGLSEVLVEDSLNDEQKNHLDIIRQSAQNILILINDILDFSRIESGKFDVEITECSLKHLLAVIESLMRPQVMNKNLDFGIFQKTNLPENIKTDPIRLRQCIMNFTNNAINFTEKGHIHINVSMVKQDDTDCIRFDIEDTGTGLSRKDQAELFNGFTSPASLAGSKSTGSGLSLSLTAKLIDILGGKVEIQSKLTEGSKFSIIIPTGVKVQEQPILNKYEELKKEKRQAHLPSAQQLSGRVLVAEDTPTNQILIRLLLEKLGLEVVIADDGKIALDKALSEDFDIILMDMQMPNMNGYDATRKLRESGFTKPVIAVTAHAMKGDREKCIAAGCDDYVSKPIDRNQLIAALRSHMQSEPQTLDEKVQKATTQVEEITDMVAGGTDTITKPEDQQSDTTEMINYNAVKDICGDESVITEVVEMFLKDSPRCISSIAEAIKSANPKHIRMYAHSLKGASLQIGANKLGDVAHQLECAGRDKLMRDIPVLFSTVQDEYGKLTLFLSQPNWMELAKQHLNA